jgi:glycosyltransferase involved in cell wall biosynthesis
MRVGLNLVFLVPGETGGMEVYARELIQALLRLPGELELTAFVNREAAEGGGLFDGALEEVQVPVHARNRADWVRGEQQHLPRLAKAAGCELVHSLASTAPVRGPFRRVTTIHDLIYRLFPEAHFGLRTLGMRVLIPLAARRSDRVIVDAQSTRDDIVRYLGLAAERIDVVPLGVGHGVTAAPAPEADLRGRLELGDRRVLLSVSAKRPHKNLPRLIEALSQLPSADRPVLVIPGYPTPHEQELRECAGRLKLEADVRFPAWLTDAELEGLYRLADCFVFPSLYEGFGLPVLEAMSRELPVTCSDRGSLREVAGDAALLFDPEDPGAIAAAIQRVLNEPSLAGQLRRAGLAQAARFSWERTAQGTLESYERALSSQDPH